MAQCKVNKITIVCEKWKRRNLNSDNAMEEVQKIIELKESEMPPCTCAKPKDACPMKPQETAACPMKSTESHVCAASETESCPVCHAGGPSTVALLHNIYD